MDRKHIAFILFLNIGSGRFKDECRIGEYVCVAMASSVFVGQVNQLPLWGSSCMGHICPRGCSSPRGQGVGNISFNFEITRGLITFQQATHNPTYPLVQWTWQFI